MALQDSLQPHTKLQIQITLESPQNTDIRPSRQDSLTQFLTLELGLNVLEALQVFWMCCQVWEFLCLGQESEKEGVSRKSRAFQPPLEVLCFRCPAEPKGYEVIISG